MIDVIGSLDTRNENDVYTVTLTAGVTYFIEVDGDSYGTEATSLTLDDPKVLLRGPGGTVLAENDDIDLGDRQDSRIVFTATETDTYRIVVSGFTADLLGTYRLIVAEDDLRGTVEGAGAAGALAQDSAVTGTLDYAGAHGLDGDVDIFTLNLVRGLRYEVRVLGAPSGTGTLAQASVDLFNNFGNLDQSVTAEVGADLVLQIDPAQVPLYHLAVRDAAQGAGGSFVVQLSAGRGTAGADETFGSDADDVVELLGGDDTAFLGLGRDVVRGGEGLDTLNGGLGNDRLEGGDGEDVLFGDTDNDVLIGQQGADRLYGSTGDDRFVFFRVRESERGASDVIGWRGLGLEGVGVAGGDVIDLSAIDGDSRTDGFQGLVFDGSEGLGKIWILDNAAGNTVILAETNGRRGDDFRLVIQDGDILASAYTADEFVL